MPARQQAALTSPSSPAAAASSWSGARRCDRRAGGVGVGAPASALPASTASAGPGVRFVTTAQGKTWAYAIRDGAVSAVATAAPALARRS